LPQVANPKGHVVIAALTADAIRARGKVEPDQFFPGFCQHLAEQGYAVHFASSPAELAERLALPNAALIHLYNEEREIPEAVQMAAFDARAQVVFNNVRTGSIIGHKARTNAWLSGLGIAMPSMTPRPGATVFSNAPAATSHFAWLVDDPAQLDPDRYNTEFIDTTFDFGAKSYFATVRLLCVGRSVVHAFVGLRSADRARPSVHGVTTPLNAPLFNAAYQSLFLDRLDEMQALARDLNSALGPGFYHHDLLVERGTGKIYLCEVGYKFDAYAFGSHMEAVRADVPSLEIFFNGDYARRSADAVLSEWRHWNGTEETPTP
jgi:hypothetical protein